MLDGILDNVKASLERYVEVIARQGAEEAAAKQKTEITRMAESWAQDVIVPKLVIGGAATLLAITLSAFAYTRARRPRAVETRTARSALAGLRRRR